MIGQDLFQKLRLANLFGGNQDFGGEYRTPLTGLPPNTGPNMPNEGVIDPDQNPIEHIRRASLGNQMQSPLDRFEPETRSTERFNRLLDEYPERNKPGIFRKLGAGIVGIGGGDKEEVDTALYGPYKRELEDWKTKAGPFGNAANLERQGNINERQLVYQTEQARTSGRRADIAESEAERRAREGESRNAVAQARLQLDRFKAENPGSKILAPKGGTIKFVNPVTGVVKDTGINTGTMTDEDRINLEIEGRESVARIRESDDDPSNWVVVPQYNAQGLPIGSVRVHKGSGEAIPVTIGAGSKKEPVITRGSATQAKVGRAGRAQQAINEHPEWSKFISIDPNSGEVKVKAPGAGGLPFGLKEGMTTEMHQEILDYLNQTPEPEIKPDKKNIPSARARGAGPAGTSSQDKSKSKYKIGDTKIFPNGNKGRWDGNGWVLIQPGR